MANLGSNLKMDLEVQIETSKDRQLQTWKDIEVLNEKTLGMIEEMGKKKSYLREIHLKLGEVHPNNMKNALKALGRDIEDYLQVPSIEP